MKDGTIHRRVLDYAYTDTATLYRDFHISEQGYTEKQVEESRTQYGSNILSGRASDTVLYSTAAGLLSIRLPSFC